MTQNINARAHVEQIIKLTNADSLRWRYGKDENYEFITASYRAITIEFEELHGEDLYFSNSENLQLHYDLSEEIFDGLDLTTAINDYKARRLAETLNLDLILLNMTTKSPTFTGTIVMPKDMVITQVSNQTEEGYFPIDSVYKHLKDNCKYPVRAMVETSNGRIVVPEIFEDTNDQEIVAVAVLIDDFNFIEVTWNGENYVIEINKGKYTVDEDGYTSDSVYDVLERVNEIVARVGTAIH